MRQRLILWFAIAFSTVVYFILAWTMSGTPDELSATAREQYVPILYGLALVMFVIAWFVVPRVVRSGEQLRMITAMAVFEACAIFGLVGAFLTKDWRLYLFPWALAVVGFLRERPRSAAVS